MASIQTVNLLRSIWKSDVIPLLEADLLRCQAALIKADSIDDIRRLQGRANALLSMLRLPEHLAAELTEETNGKLDS